MLDRYIQQTQRLIGDVKAQLYNPFDLVEYINMARRQVAEEGQCCRMLTPIASSVSTIDPTAIGSGYTSVPTVTVSPPDLPGTTATATAIQVGSFIGGYTVTNAGSGYMFEPTITVSGGGGHGATGKATLNYTLQAITNQETYNFADIPVSSILPGASEIFAVQSIAVIWSNVRYVGNRVSWSKYQALVRAYTAGNFLYTPFWFSQFGQGTAGSIFTYPVADQLYPMEWDCLVLPQDLTAEGETEIIPQPWSDAVPYFAAFLALSSLADPARIPLADRYWNPRDGGIFGSMMRRARAYAQPNFVSSWYGRALA